MSPRIHQSFVRVVLKSPLLPIDSELPLLNYSLFRGRTYSFAQGDILLGTGGDARTCPLGGGRRGGRKTFER